MPSLRVFHDCSEQVNGLCADLGGVQPERMEFDVCAADDDGDSAVLFLCDDRDRVALAFCMNGGGNIHFQLHPHLVETLSDARSLS